MEALECCALHGKGRIELQQRRAIAVCADCNRGKNCKNYDCFESGDIEEIITQFYLFYLVL